MYCIKHERPSLATFPNTEKKVENTTRSGVVLMNCECGQTLSGVFDISSQLKLKLRRKRRTKIVKIYAN